MDLTLWVLSSADTYCEKGRKIRLQRERKPPKLEQIQHLINVILVIAVLVATVTFSAALTVPGGFNRSDAGHKNAFWVFIICDSIAMYVSMTGAFVLIWALVASDWEKFAINNALYLLVVAIFTMSMAFIAVVYIALSDIPWIAYLVMSTQFEPDNIVLQGMDGLSLLCEIVLFKPEVELMMAKVELTMRATEDEWCCKPKNGLVALVCGKGELRVGRERVMGNRVRGTKGEIALEGLRTEGVKASG
ncbi:hypothetical protein SO802_005189 [Lithocarpus litseifolius]|uniref:PGG domain-containing protein n=1 Tax=Lithocarpus litseifolius TaxID=425828 RepID=A0AAW2DM29_9ROSI